MVTYPEDWREVKLGEALVYTQPTNYIENNYVEHGAVPVLTAGKSFILGYSDKTDSAYKNLPAILFDDFTTEVRYLDYPFMVKSSATKFLNLKSDYYDIKYLYYWLDKLKFQIEAHERHWISRFSKFDIVLPPLAEQQAIASAISAFDEHIDNLTELIEKKKAIRDGALEDLVSGRTRLDGFNGEWEECKFKDICKINQGLQIEISARYIFPGENRYFYITNEFLKENSNERFYIKNPPLSTICSSEDILMTRTGNTGMVVTNVAGVFHNNFFKIDFKRSLLEKEFLYYLLISKEYNMRILKVAGSSTIPDLNHKNFYKIALSFPKQIQEQQAIAEVLTAMDEEIESLKIEKEKMIQIKEGVMDDLLTGRVRLKV